MSLHLNDKKKRNEHDSRAQGNASGLDFIPDPGCCAYEDALLMPTKIRRERKTRQVADRQRTEESIPPHIRQRIEARKTGSAPASTVLTNLLDSEDPSYLSLQGGLLTFDSSGNPYVNAAGDKTGSANKERAETRQTNIESLQNVYPQYWLKRSGAKAIALSEQSKSPQKRAVKPTKGFRESISERTVQDYFKRIRKAKRVP